MNRCYETKQLILKILEPNDALKVLDYYKRNKEFLNIWEPVKDDMFYERVFQEKLLNEELEDMIEGKALKFWLFKKEDENKIIGSIAFNNIIRGSFQSCFVGYKMDKGELNKGYMTEALNKSVEIIFNEYKLHRIEANIMPKNTASIRVVSKCGFRHEGLAKKYLKINGQWEDHIHMVLINEESE